MENFKELADEVGLPNPQLNKKNQNIDRNECYHFNTQSYWHCFYHRPTGKLVNEYDKLLMKDGTKYLQEIGLLNEKKEQIGYFQNEDGTTR